MTNNNNQVPDRAGANDFDDLDVPTYRGDGAAPENKASSGDDIYSRTGRAAPQSIPPRADAETVSLDRAEAPLQSDAPVRSDAPLRSDAPTTAFDRPSTPPPAAPAAPAAEPYRDQDFAQPAAPRPAQPEVIAPPAAPVATPAPGYPENGYLTDQEEEEAAVALDPRRGTMDWGILILRLLLGAYLVITALGTFFRLGGNSGLSGLEAEFASYNQASLLSIAVPSMQLAAGVFLIFGLITPLFAAVATIVTSFMALHALTQSGVGFNIFAWPETVTLPIMLLVISLVLQFTGPGLYSFDLNRSWARRPLASSWIFVVLAIAGGVALWWFGAGVNPLR